MKKYLLTLLFLLLALQVQTKESCCEDSTLTNKSQPTNNTQEQNRSHKLAIHTLLDQIKEQIGTIDPANTKVLTLISQELLEILEMVKSITIRTFDFNAWSALVDQEERNKPQN